MISAKLTNRNKKQSTVGKMLDKEVKNYKEKSVQSKQNNRPNPVKNKYPENDMKI